MKPRPWCACGKVRLADRKAFHTEETPKRLWLHEADSCRVWVINPKPERTK